MKAGTLLFSTAFLVSSVLVELVRRWAFRRSILDVPNVRSSHTAPTPRGGGIGIVCVVVAVMIFFGFTEHSFFVLAAASTGVALIGWADDVRSQSVVLRFLVHTVAAAAAIAAFGPIGGISLPDADIRFGLLAVPVTLLWIVGLTNAYNFMDGIDGIAGAQAIAAAVGIVIVAMRDGERSIAWIAISIAGSSAGFLLRNWERARIFMGDVGSGFLGFVFSILAIAGGRQDNRMPVYAAMFLSPFIIDSTFTFLRRLVRRENVFSAHRSHLYQRLVSGGLRHWHVALLYAALAFGAVAAVATMPVANAWLAIGVPAAIAFLLWTLTTGIERRSAIS